MSCSQMTEAEIESRVCEDTPQSSPAATQTSFHTAKTEEYILSQINFDRIMRILGDARIGDVATERMRQEAD